MRSRQRIKSFLNRSLRWEVQPTEKSITPTTTQSLQVMLLMEDSLWHQTWRVKVIPNKAVRILGRYIHFIKTYS